MTAKTYIGYLASRISLWLIGRLEFTYVCYFLEA
jgi:hypothetical protein